VRGSGVEGGVSWVSWVSNSAMGVGRAAGAGIAVGLWSGGGGLTYLHRVC